LQRWAQAADELPMVALGLACAWTMAQREAPLGAGRRLAAGFLVFGLLFVWAYTVATWAFLLFIGVYGVIVAWLAIRTLYLSFVAPAPVAIRRAAVAVVVAYLGSFSCFWVPEHLLFPCDHPLQRLQLHGLWHLGAGLGTVTWWWWAMRDRERLVGVGAMA
jgi:hypothetical protein